MRRLLAVACLVLAALAGLPWLVPVQSEDPAVVAPVPPAFAESDLSLPPLDALSETTARPVFVATRRPPPVAAAEPAAEPLLLGRYRLHGVVIMPNKRLVLVAPEGGGRVMQLAEGQAIDGWTVERIAPDQLTLRSGDTVEHVPLVQPGQK